MLLLVISTKEKQYFTAVFVTSSIYNLFKGLNFAKLHYFSKILKQYVFSNSTSFNPAWLPGQECHYITRKFVSVKQVILGLPSRGIKPIYE